MQRLVQLAVAQPITVTVGVVLSVLAGLIAFTRVPIQMTPTVDSVVISVSTFWETASAAEIESDIIEQQEARLSDVNGLVAMTSLSQSGRGTLRLEFSTGTEIERARAEVDQKLAEVPGYPDGVDQPVVEAVDPETIDYISWVGLSATDPAFDATTLFDFMERRLRPRLERIDGVSRVGIIGARESEVRVAVDPEALASRGITWSQLYDAVLVSNENFSGGRVEEGKNEVRIRSLGRFVDPETVGALVLRRDESGPVRLGDVATVELTHKEKADWVRARGVSMPFFNFQLRRGANLLATMDRIHAELDRLNAPGGLLEQQARTLGIDGTLELVETYDASGYVDDAIGLVQSNILVGGTLAVLTLLFFLRSLRTIGIIAIAIPISVIAAIAILVAMDRSVNIISLAGMAFATGMVVDNAIVVIENIFRHMEMGKSPRVAALDATSEVAGAVFASTMTTIVVFLPILLIQDAAGQLFRDIALAIMAAVGTSMIVSLTVIPSAAGRLLRPRRTRSATAPTSDDASGAKRGRGAAIRSAFVALLDLPGTIAGIVRFLIGGWGRRIAVTALFVVVTVIGIVLLRPPLDYLPVGNRGLAIGILIPPPGYGVDQLSAVGERLEAAIEPAWNRTEDKFRAEARLRGGPRPTEDARTPVMTMDGREVMPPPLDHYFLVAWDGAVFHIGIPEDPARIPDLLALFDQAGGGGNAPDMFAFSFQFPLFNTGGRTGSAIKVDLTGADLDALAGGAGALLGALMFDERFGPYSTQPEPANFGLPTPELRMEPLDERLRDLGMSRRDLGLAAQALGDGILVPRAFQLGGELKDIKLVSANALSADPIRALIDTPLATPDGSIVDVESLANVTRVREPGQIKHVDRERGITLQVTPPPGMPLEEAIVAIEDHIESLRTGGAIAPGIEVSMSGSAGRLAEVRKALLGDGTVLGTITSSFVLALLVVYLLMSVLFQSWSAPLVIMVTVPLATLGGFVGLAIVHAWSVADPYMPVQNLDVLTILGFVILAGVVVNNAILIVHQTRNLVRQHPTRAGDVAQAREMIVEATRSRVRPILMSTMTSVGGMLPLVLMPGSGSELYRGLGAVVVGGLVLSTVFTLFLVPVVLSMLPLRRFAHTEDAHDVRDASASHESPRASMAG